MVEISELKKELSHANTVVLLKILIIVFTINPTAGLFVEPCQDEFELHLLYRKNLGLIVKVFQF